MRNLRLLLGTLLIAAIPVAAHAVPSVSAVLHDMRESFDPPRPSTRTMTITVDNLGETRKFVARQARKQMPDGKRMATVVLEPAELRGTAYLVFAPKDQTKPTLMWMYVPFVRRVRELIAIDTYEHFLGTDFTYADLGFSFMRSQKNYRVTGPEQHAGIGAYRVEEKLPPDQMYYSRIMVWIAQSTMLPIKRDYYDPTGRLWKKETFDSVSTIDGMPTVLHVQMKDLEANTSSDLSITQVKYDVEIPDTLFDPQSLPRLTDNAQWQSGGTDK